MMGSRSVQAGQSDFQAAMRIAVIGYGPNARDLALRLRAGGHDLAVGMLTGGMSRVRAVRDGFRPVPAGAAVVGCDTVVILVADADQPSLYSCVVEPSAARGPLVVFERGHALYSGAITPTSADVVLVAPSDTGCRVAVHHDATGRALERAIAYARASHGVTARVTTTTVAEEVEAALAAEELRAGGLDAMLADIDEALERARDSHAPDEGRLAFYEGLRAAIEQRGHRSSARILSAAAFRGAR